MAITLTNVTDAIQARGYGSDTLTTQQELVRAELRRIYGLRRWKWLDKTGTLTLTAAVDSVSLSGLSDLRAIDAVRASFSTTEYDDMEWLPEQQLRKLSHVERDDRDVPMYWTQFADKILVHPRPDRAYTLTVDYGRRTTLPTSGSDTIVLPDEYLDVLVWGAVAALAFRQRDWTGQAAAKTMHDELLAEMIREDSIQQRQSSARVQHSSFWDDY